MVKLASRRRRSCCVAVVAIAWNVGGDHVVPAKGKSWKKTTTATSSMSSRRDATSSATNQLGAIVRGGAAREPAPNNDADDGAVNERRRSWERLPEEDAPSLLGLSNLLHALVGLDRYPNYLSRWPLEDAVALERTLEARAAEVRRQREEVARKREETRALVKEALQSSRLDEAAEHDESTNDERRRSWFLAPPDAWDVVRDRLLDARASRAIFGSRTFRRRDRDPPTVRDVRDGDADVELDQSLLEEWLDQECFDVYSFQLLSKEFCDDLRAVIRRVVSHARTNERWRDLPLVKTNTVDLDAIGLEWINDLLFRLVVRPLSRHLFRATELDDEHELDFRHGYVARLAAPSGKAGGGRSRLVPHTDDAEITLNVFLGDRDVEGGDLIFSGLRGTPDEGVQNGDPVPRDEIGAALLHAGRHLHEVTRVTAGERFTLILWSRSVRGLRAEVCPCCWLTRRTGQRCVCGRRWN